MESKTSYPKEKINILMLEGVHPAAINLFHENGYKSIEVLKSSLQEKELISKIRNVHLLGTRSKTKLPAKVFESGRKLLAAGVFSIGTSQVDLVAATRNGVAVFNSPYSNTRSVAEMVIALSMVLMRRIPEKNTAAHAGTWDKGIEGCKEIRGKTLGIIGYGHIGSQVSVLAESISMKVMYYDVEPKLSMGNAVKAGTMEALLKNSDVVTIHIPGGAKGGPILNEAMLKKMKKGSILINLSRGDVIDLQALKSALQEKHIYGAGIDVFVNEPKDNSEPFSNILQGMPNVVLTPHIGGSTLEAQESIGVDVATKLISFLETGSSTGSLSIPSLSLPLQHEAHRILHIHRNMPGILSEVNSTLSGHQINLIGQYLKTNNEIGYAVLDVDQKNSAKALSELKKVRETIKVRPVY